MKLLHYTGNKDLNTNEKQDNTAKYSSLTGKFCTGTFSDDQPSHADDECYYRNDKCCKSSGKAVILLLIFMLFGIMNPAIAKLTPWMMESMADSMAETGLVMTAVEVDAMTSWTQFYKNAPMALIVFLLMFSGILTTEYQSGTLINMVTKGIVRWKILAAKEFTVLMFWTFCYWMMYGITYGYNLYFWDNSKLAHPVFAAFCFYLEGGNVFMVTKKFFI